MYDGKNKFDGKNMNDGKNMYDGKSMNNVKTNDVPYPTAGIVMSTIQNEP